MSFPPDVPLVTLELGPFLDVAGKPLSQVIRIDPPQPIIHVPTGATIFDGHALEAHHATVQLLPTDLEEASPKGYTLTVTVGTQKRHIHLPQAIPHVNLQKLVAEQTEDHGEVWYPAEWAIDQAARAEAAADRAETAEQGAGAARLGAETARDQTEAISGLTGEDDAVAFLVGSPASSTRTALEDAGLGRPASDEDVAALVAQPTSAAHHALTQSLRTVAAGPPRAAGAVCFTWDDGYPNWLSIAQAASARGQRHTFCVQTNRIDAEGGIPAADVLAIHEMGHEIAAHSVSHINHAASTPAQRAAQYDGAKAALEAIVGAGNVTTYVYPLGGVARDNTTDMEAWGRYARLRDTSGTGWTAMEERTGPFLIPSITWTHRIVLASIRRAAVQPMIFNVFAHNPDGLVGGVPDVTTVKMLEAMDLAQSLGVPCVTMRDAYPGGGLITSPTFDGDIGGWRPIGDSGAVTVEPMVNPPAGFGDQSVVRVTTTTTQFSGIRELVPVVPGRTYVIACWARAGADGSGSDLSGGGYAMTRFARSSGYDGRVVGWDDGEALADGRPTSIAPVSGDHSGNWVQIARRLTVPDGRRFLEVQLGATGKAGITVEFAHVWVGEERFGVFA